MFRNEINLKNTKNRRAAVNNKNHVNISPHSMKRALRSLQDTDSVTTEPPMKARKLNNAKKQPYRL